MKIRDIIEFANEHGNGKVFKGWTEKEIEAHLTFQANDGTLMVTESDGEITSFATYKQIKNFDGDIERVFWEPTDKTGDDIYIHELVSVDGTSTSHMLTVFERSCADADRLNYWAHRKDKLKKYSYKQLKRFLCHHQKHHHHQITPQQTEKA